MKKTGTDKTCQSCGCLFYVAAWREAKGVAKFCSVACKAAAGSPLKGARTLISKTCNHCGVEYKVEPSRVDNTRYCSLQCHGFARSAEYNKAKAESPKHAAKKCSKCGLEKSLVDFPRRASSVDGVRADCKTCFSGQQRDWRIRNADKKKATDSRLYQENKESRKAWGAQYYASNKDRITVRAKRYYAAAKPDFVARAKTRKISKRRATPAWASLNAIRKIYRECERISVQTGVRHHVDHIVPLQSEIVCGLHWEQNLQILPGAENIAKGNRYWPDMP